MAPEHRGGAGPDTPTVPLADGGAEDRAAEGEQGGVRPECDIMPKSGENAGFLACFVVSFTHGTREENCRKHPGHGDHLTGGI